MHVKHKVPAVLMLSMVVLINGPERHMNVGGYLLTHFITELYAFACVSRTLRIQVLERKQI